MTALNSPITRLALAGLVLLAADPRDAWGEGWKATESAPMRTIVIGQPAVLTPAAGAKPLAASHASRPPATREKDTSGGVPSAILIRNPNAANGEPPFALADQFGRVQRLVEPSSGINLHRRVGQIVAVEHDTGRTLLASQLRFGVDRLPTDPADTAAPTGIALAGPATSRHLETRPVLITQFSEDTSGAAPLPEPIVLEEIIGDPVIQPIEGLPLPSPQGLQKLSLSQPSPSAPTGQVKKSACLTPGCGCCDTASPNIYFELELLLLRMFDSEPSVTNDGFESGSRFTLGVKTPGGSHWAARYLEYENNGYDADGGNLSLDMYDLEYGRCFNLGCRWQGLFTVGGRLTELQDTEDVIRYQDAIGPVFGVQLRGPQWGSFHPLLGARHALQVGEAATADGDAFGAFSITELAAGIEYQRRTRKGTVFARIAAESLFLDGPLSNDSENAALFGAGLSIGIAR